MTILLKLTRRAALAGFAGAGGLLAAGRPGFSLAADPAERVLTEAAMSLFTDPAHVRQVGAACLDRQELCGSRATLIEEIFGAERQRLASCATTAEIHDWLRTRIREDFAAGRSVTVQGWVLARTEARLYALATHA
jgi:hypothetical protein